MLEPIEAASLQVMVYHRLKAALMMGDFAPGQVLLIRDLAEQLGTSHMPIRQSLSRLISEHAVVEDGKARASVRVPELSNAVFDDLRSARILVESEAAARAASRISRAEVQELERLNLIIDESIAARDAVKAIRANHDFHFTLYRIAGSETLMRIIESLWLQSGPYFRVLIEHYLATVEADGHGPVMEEALRSNREILSALQANDPSAARAALVADIEQAARFFLAMTDQERAKGSLDRTTEPRRRRGRPRER